MLEFGSTIYIAGPMRSVQCYNFPRFFYWQIVLEQSGYVVINPAFEDCMRWIKDGWLFTDDQWQDVMDKDLELIRTKADALFVLRGWGESKGAKMEIKEAGRLGIPVFYEEKR